MKTLRRPLGVSFRITGAPSDPGAVALGEFMRARHMSQLTGLAAWSKWRLSVAPWQRPSSASVPGILSDWHPRRPSSASPGRAWRLWAALGGSGRLWAARHSQ